MGLRLPGSVKFLAWILAAVGVLVTAQVLLTVLTREDYCWECDYPKPPSPPSTRSSNSTLKTLASAQADFRGNDRDGNGRQDFWRADVAGLYVFTPPNDAPIKLIELSMAAADAAPVSGISAFTRRRPKAGFWYKSIRHADEDPAKPDPKRFAFCAYPNHAHAGSSVFIISEENVIYKRPWKGPEDVPSVYPDPATLKREWSKLD